MMRLTDREVAAEIAIREVSDLNRQDLNDLACLYIVQDRMQGRTAQEPQTYSAGYSQAAGPDTAGDYGDSDFLRAIAGRELPAVFDILDELMETLRVVNTRAYDGVMRRIKSI